jgi:uncharacterized protein (DUF2267 family)
MSVKAIHNFEHAVHVANEWIKSLAGEPEIGSEAQAYVVLRTVLHALRDRLQIDEVAHLSAQLPMLVRGFFFEGWVPTWHQDTQPDSETSDQFLDEVSERLRPLSEVDVEDAVYLVYALMSRRFSEGELVYVERALPSELVQRWAPSLPKTLRPMPAR